VALAAAGLAGGITARFVFGAPAVAQACFLAALIGGGVPLIWQTLRGLLRGKFAADVVAALAIGTALALREYFAGAVIVLMQSRWKRCWPARPPPPTASHKAPSPTFRSNR
jgi:cation transport ATPase